MINTKYLKGLYVIRIKSNLYDIYFQLFYVSFEYSDKYLIHDTHDIEMVTFLHRPDTE